MNEVSVKAEEAEMEDIPEEEYQQMVKAAEELGESTEAI